jgi:drug/metabolite transporter (DMT)-like permease
MTDSNFPPLSQNTMKGVALVSAAVFLFAVSDVIGKYLAMQYAVPFIMAVRYMINLGLLAALLGPRHGSGLWHTNRTWLVLARGLCLAAGSLTMGLALRVMPVGETVAIVYIAPFLVMLIAGRFMGETVSFVGWIGAVCGFLGVLLIMRPGSGLEPMGVTLCLFNAGCATAYHLLTRVLARTETMTAMVFQTAFVGAVVFVTLALFALDGRVPGWQDGAVMAALGIAATAGHFLFTAAYREAPASVLAPINYLHLVWAGLLGWVVFAHVPDAFALCGMAVVVLSGVAVAIAARRESPVKEPVSV